MLMKTFLLYLSFVPFHGTYFTYRNFNDLLYNFFQIHVFCLSNNLLFLHCLKGNYLKEAQENGIRVLLRKTPPQSKMNSYYHFFIYVTPFLKSFILVIIFIKVPTIVSIPKYLYKNKLTVYTVG